MTTENNSELKLAGVRYTEDIQKNKLLHLWIATDDPEMVASFAALYNVKPRILPPGDTARFAIEANATTNIALVLGVVEMFQTIADMLQAATIKGGN